MATIKNFNCQTQLGIDGFLSHSELMALIAIIYAVKNVDKNSTN